MISRGCRICLGVSILLLIIVATIIVSLSLTVFKLKDPNISLNLVGLENFKISLSPDLASNVTLGMIITMENPNYGSFEYKNTTGYVNYHDSVVAEVPIESEFVPARDKINVSTYANFMVGKLVKNPKFWTDVGVGTLNLTSTAELPGQARILKFIKLKATAYSICDISFHIISRDVQSKCVSKIKL